jgi:hypothetical protein
MKLLKDCVPEEFIDDYQDTKAFKFLEIGVKKEHENKVFPGKHKNVHVWWELENGYAVGWNENPSIGWSFPVVKL